MIKFENKSKNKKQKSHRFFDVSPKIQRSSNLLFPLQARGLEGIKCILNIRACLMRFPHLRLAMTISAMVALYLGIISESWATCNGATVTTAGTDENGDYCGICNDAGTCKWKLNSSGELNVYAADGAKEVAMNDYPTGSFTKSIAPWSRLGATSLIIGDNIINIGEKAFLGESSITSVSGMNDVVTINGWAFDGASGITKLVIPDSVTTLGYGSIAYMSSLTSLALPDSITSVSYKVFEGTNAVEELIITDNLDMSGWLSKLKFNANMTIRCLGKMAECKKAVSGYYKGTFFDMANQTQCTGSNYYWNGKSCSNKKNGIVCADGFKRIEDFCNRVRYSPAEAAEIANEDNTNVVTITFRK